jgi:hypothetical protein
MNKRVIITTQSEFEAMKKLLDDLDAWEKVEIVIVKDTDFEESIKIIEDGLPEGKIIRRFELEEST